MMGAGDGYQEQPMRNNPDQWVGRQQRLEDVIHASTARAMQATLSRDVTLRDGDALPPLWHWLYFHDLPATDLLGPDGHSQRGSFLPPIDLPRRMWAGGQFEFHAPIIIGSALSRTSTIKGITHKKGRSGALCFVAVEHAIHDSDGQLLLREIQDIVYREAATRSADQATDAPPAPGDSESRTLVRETIEPSSTLLFRYSALTFNSHRIHYDSDYVRDVEGYEGLVFHGPLTATLLLDLALRSVSGNVTGYTFRATAAIVGTAAFDLVCSLQSQDDPKRVVLQAIRADGVKAMQAEAQFEP